MFTHFELSESLLKAITQLNWEQPTDIQQAVIPKALEQKDLLLSASTGSGKSAAFLLPLLERLIRRKKDNTDTLALILSPTRELASQLFKDCQALAAFTDINSIVITGGESLKPQAAKIRKNPEIVIATPGRLLEHLTAKQVFLQDLEYLVIDEADRMLDMGFHEDVLNIVKACQSQRQTLLCSATLSDPAVLRLAREIMTPDAEHIDLTETQEQPSIRQQIILADDRKHKERLLDWLLQNETYDKTIIFCNTRDQADALGNVLRYHDYRVEVLHGEKQHQQRKKVMQAFTNQGLKILVASDVAARGLDIDGINLVINFDFARKGDDHLHRVGRTGRAGTEGLAISFVTANEWNLMVGIERYLGIHFEQRQIKALKGSFTGPKKLKASGKAYGSKKKKNSSKADVKKSRPAKKPTTDSGGFGVIRKKTKKD
ncbi:DEAD/DEAH box helicase [Gynuella sunshinyii]|uniref:Superfamily II DNA and RNA helicase n=1 Tax=Gynuella sunshinyii YC6258 TaxID=1445510 RepID=A0A0C5VEK6_9GAMM|nr:DEAD/DEAH box helicase [Gynuella sunshinyii]AJQ97705.1 superfamily II DNA and RNA helicase [Gynuella sunshinyii YC6258]